MLCGLPTGLGCLANGFRLVGALDHLGGALRN
jgi:hypothetical protein